MKYVVWLWRNTKGIRWNPAVRIVVGIIQVVSSLLMVWLCRQFIDETILMGSDYDIWGMILLLVATVVGGVLLRQLYYYMTTMVGIRMTNTIRLRTFSNLFSRQLYDDHELHSGDVTSRLSKDIETVSEITTSTIPQMIITTLRLAGAFLLMRYFDELLAWSLLLITPIAIIFGKLIARQLREMTRDIREDESRIQMQIQEGMEHNAVLRSLQSEQWVTDRLHQMQQHLHGNVLRRTRFSLIIRLLIGLAFGLGYLMAFIWGGIQLRNGAITFGVMTSFLQLVGMIQHPIFELLNLVPGLIHASANIDRLEELNVSASTTFSAGEAALQPQGIRFHDVTFHYAAGDRDIIHHFSHDFRPATKTALMGETGIGKTTLFRLMLSFIRPDSGQIEIYGEGEQAQAVSETTRANFVFVPQGNTLMSGTIRYNLQLAKPDATENELKEVLHTACADFVFDLPEGLDTELGERGSGLSEGQAQRIAIARGLLHGGDILLLDEISSSLDEETERELYHRLFIASPENTMLFITHRATITELCDEVIKM